MDDAEFFSRLEDLVRQAELSESYRANKELDWDILEPIISLIAELVNAGGQQDPDRPGKIRIDMGRPRAGGGLEPNLRTILVVDFDCLDDGPRFFAKFDFADELVRYAAVGEQGWDVRRQIYELERTIEHLKDEATSRGWHIPDFPPGTVFVD